MESNQTYVLVPKLLAQHTRKILEANGCLKKKIPFCVFDGDDLIGLPVTDSHASSISCHGCDKLEHFGFRTATAVLKLQDSEANIRHQRLIQECTRVLHKFGFDLDERLRNDVAKTYERCEDLVILPASAFNEPEWYALSASGKLELWTNICKILRVKRLAKKLKMGVQNDVFRSPSVVLLHGCEQSSWAKKVENGITYTWDVTRSMFCPGNITEKLRVASFDCTGEVVVDLYAGIGYFTLPFLVHAGAAHVYACEWNPAAVEALKRNLLLNKVQEKCTLLEGDNRETCPLGIADRVNLGLIPSSSAGYKSAVRALKCNTGGVLHIHGNIRTRRATESKVTRFDEIKRCFAWITAIEVNLNRPNQPDWMDWCFETTKEIASHLDTKLKWKLRLLHLEHVKTFAPFVDHVVLDLHCDLK